MARATAQRLQPQCAGSREHIQDADTGRQGAEARPVGVAMHQYVEQRLAGAVCRGPHPLVGCGFQFPAAMLAADDAHYFPHCSPIWSRMTRLGTSLTLPASSRPSWNGP